MGERRYDITYGPQEGQCGVEPHFCREWEDRGDGRGVTGCYGTNPHHGFTWEDARKEVSDYYRRLADEWAAKEEEGGEMVEAKPRFKVGDAVRVLLGREYVGVVLGVHQDETDGHFYYTVSIPEDMRGRGRNYVEEWAYREQYLEPAG